MKISPLLILAILLAALRVTAPAQEAETEGAESAARSVLGDPRLQNVFRSVKNDPEAAAAAAQKDPDSLVRDAIGIFQDNKDKIDTSAIDTPENRARAQEVSTTAVAKAREMAGQDGPPEDKPARERPSKEEKAVAKAADKEKDKDKEKAKPKATPAEVPATRPATGNVITPIAMPVEETPQPLATDAMPETVVQDKEVKPIATAEPTEPVIPDTPQLREAEVPEPQALEPHYKTKQGGGYQSADKDHMAITSKESVMDNAKGLLIFTGNVFVDHPEFEIKCEKLEIFMAEGAMAEGGEKSSEAPFKRAIASGGMVEIKRTSPDGKLQIALARRADYDAITKDIVLSGGPPYIQDGDRFVKTNSPDSQIIMRGTGQYEITGSDAGAKNRTQIVIPIKNKGKGKGKGKKGADPIGIPGIGDSLDRLR